MSDKGKIVIISGLFLAWSFVPQNVMPPEVIAILDMVRLC